MTGWYERGLVNVTPIILNFFEVTRAAFFSKSGSRQVIQSFGLKYFIIVKIIKNLFTLTLNIFKYLPLKSKSAFSNIVFVHRTVKTPKTLPACGLARSEVVFFSVACLSLLYPEPLACACSGAPRLTNCVCEASAPACSAQEELSAKKLLLTAANCCWLLQTAADCCKLLLTAANCC